MENKKSTMFCSGCKEFIEVGEESWYSLHQPHDMYHPMTDEHKKAAVKYPEIDENQLWEQQIGSIKIALHAGKMQEIIAVVLEDLQKTLHKNPHLRGCSLNVYGSSKTNLTIYDSDVDVLLKLKQQALTSLEVLAEVEKSLKSSNQFAYTKMAWPAINIPIVKSYHIGRNVFIDLNVNKDYVLINSEILKFYIDLDEKIYDLFLIVKQFMRVRSYDNLKFYSVQLLLIFYLQRHLKQVPQLRELLHPRHSIDTEWSWSFSAPKDVTLDKMSLQELVSNFLKFVHDFKFDNVCILTKDAVYIDNKCMTNADLLPKSQLQLIKKMRNGEKYAQLNSAVNIQEIVLLNTNVTSFVSKFTMKKFQRDCGRAYKKIQKQGCPITCLFNVDCH